MGFCRISIYTLLKPNASRTTQRRAGWGGWGKDEGIEGDSVAGHPRLHRRRAFEGQGRDGPHGLRGICRRQRLEASGEPHRAAARLS